MQLCLIVWQSNASWQFSFSAGYGCEIEHPTPALLPSGMWHKCKCKRILALVQLCTCWTAVPVKSADNRGEIPELDSLRWNPFKN